MFSVAICDDEIVVCSQLERFLEPFCEQNIIKVEAYYSGEKLYNDLLRGKKFNLIFLDIRLKMMDGISLGNIIREEFKDNKMQIVFISGREDYAMDLFAVRPMHFLIKPIQQIDVTKCVEKAIELSAYYDDYFRFQFKGNLYSIHYSDIMFFAANGRKIEIHTQNETYSLYGKLDDIAEKIKKCFIRIHKSYLVNDIFVREWGYDKIVLTNDKRISISQSYRKGVRQLIHLKWKGRGWNGK